MTCPAVSASSMQRRNIIETGKLVHLGSQDADGGAPYTGESRVAATVWCWFGWRPCGKLTRQCVAGSQAKLRSVADRAMQVGEEAILGFRSHRSSRLENTSLLAAAVRLHVLVAKCASAADAADMGGLFEELLSRAAHQRFRALLTKHAADSGALLHARACLDVPASRKTGKSFSEVNSTCQHSHTV